MSKSAIGLAVSRTADVKYSEDDWNPVQDDNQVVYRDFALRMHSDEWLAYLRAEAAKRGISVAQMFEIEDQARRDIEAMGITDEFLANVWQVANPPQKLQATH